MLQSKDIEWLNVLKKKNKKQKNKAHKYAAYKRLISDLKTHTDWKWGDGKRYSKQMETKRNWVEILITDKIGFKTKTVTREKEGHYIIIKRSIQQESEMKEKIQPTPQKYKGLWDYYEQLHIVIHIKTESGKNRKYEQTNYQ